MVPRGEVSLIVGSTALALGVFDADLFGVVVAVTVITGLITAPVLGLMVRRRRLVPRRERGEG
jgi:Kef-type K+ transport system membrane component KefB